MPLPFREDFKACGTGRLARFFSDITGGFETAACAGGRQGLSYRQWREQPAHRLDAEKGDAAHDRGRGPALVGGL